MLLALPNGGLGHAMAPLMRIIGFATCASWSTRLRSRSYTIQAWTITGSPWRTTRLIRIIGWFQGARSWARPLQQLPAVAFPLAPGWRMIAHQRGLVPLLRHSAQRGCHTDMRLPSILKD